MTGDHRKAIRIRTASILVMVATMDIEPVDAQGTAISSRDHVRQTETATEPTESATYQNTFYLRIGASLYLPSTTRFGDRNCLSTSPAALYGCGTGGDGIARGTRGDYSMAAVSRSASDTSRHRVCAWKRTYPTVRDSPSKGPPTSFRPMHYSPYRRTCSPLPARSPRTWIS